MFERLLNRTMQRPDSQEDSEALLSSSSGISTKEETDYQFRRREGNRKIIALALTLSGFLTIVLIVGTGWTKSHHVVDVDRLCINHISQYCKYEDLYKLELY